MSEAEAGAAMAAPRIVAGMNPVSLSTDLLRRLARSTSLLCCMGLVGSCVVAAPVMLAQNQPARVVQGKVVDKDGGGVKAATVYLKDDHTLSVRSYIASDDGSFRFGQLAQGTDYEVWAEVNGKKSKVANLSSFDTRNTFNLTLKVDSGK